MQAGRQDRQITIEYPSRVLDPDYGTEIVTWLPLVTEGSPPLAVKFWAEIQDAMPSRSEAVTQGLNVARNQTRMRLRWRSDITSEMRVLLHGDGADETLQIVGGPADIDGRKSMVEIVCERYKL